MTFEEKSKKKKKEIILERVLFGNGERVFCFRWRQISGCFELEILVRK